MEEENIQLLRRTPLADRLVMKRLLGRYEKKKKQIMKKQFNLEKALAGDKVITRDGCEVKIAGYFDKLKYGILGWVHRENEWVARSWTKDGQFDTLASVSTNDLFMAPTTKTVWFGLYRNSNNGGVYTTPTFYEESTIRSAYSNHEILHIYSAEVEE